MASVAERLQAGQSVPVEDIIAEMDAAYPKTALFTQWCEQRDLPPVVTDRVAQLLRMLENHNTTLLDHLVLGLECNQPGISGGAVTYRGD